MKRRFPRLWKSMKSRKPTMAKSVPLLYLLFDDLSPALSKRFPALSEFFDNVIVVVLPGRRKFWPDVVL